MIFLRTRKRRILFGIACIAIIIGGYFVVRYYIKKQTYTRATPTLSRDVVGEAGNMSFIINGNEVPLKDGTATVDGLPGTIKMMSSSLQIDFNADKTMDRAVIIKNMRDDNSVYFYTSVVLVGSDGTLTNTNTILLGEGVLIQRMNELPDNMFSVEYLTRKKPTENPTIPQKRTFKVDGYVLSEIVKK